MEHLAGPRPEVADALPGSALAGAEANWLLATLPWGVLLVDAHGAVQYLNAQAATWWGVAPASAQGQALAQVGRGKLPELLYEALRRVATSDCPPADEYYLPAAGHWLAMASQPSPQGTVVHWQAIAAPRQPASLPPAPVAPPPGPAEARYHALFGAMEQACCIMEKVATAPGEPSDYRYVATNPAFTRHSGLPNAVGQTLRQLVPRVENQLLAVYDEALASGRPQYLEEYVADLDAWMATEVMLDPQPGHLALLFSNVSARHRAEQAQPENEARPAGLLAFAQRPPHQHLAPAEVTLAPETAERTWVAAERTRTEESLRRSEAEFRLLVTATSDVVYKMSPDWGQMHQLLGKSFLADTAQASGTWLERYIPRADQALVQAAIAAAIAAKSLFELEHRTIQADGQIGWVYSRALPVLDAQGAIAEWLGAAQDITARKQAEAQLQGFNARLEQQVTERTQALRQNRDLLHAIAETQTASLSAFKALRDAHGCLVDLEFLFANSVATTLAGGRPLVGQHYLPLFPEAVDLGLWDVFCRVIETGELAERELVYSEGAGMGCIHVIAIRLGADGLLVCSEDITARKLAEQAHTKALRLLAQAEAVANMGSWDYEPASGRVTWSAGMYRLFGQQSDYPTTPPHYLHFVVDEDRPLAERLVGGLRAGAQALDETLRLQVGEVVKTVRVKAVLLPGAPGQPERMLGVDLDISDLHRLEAENQALRLSQQQGLLLAILQAQEAERNRLAESLHNGLGQLLYATKLQVGQLDVPALHALPVLHGVRAHVDRLLTEAIKQTRTLSHELMPTLLTEQGLGSALRDLCRNLTTPQCHFTCQVWLGEQPLSQPLQIAVYRLAQELTHNIAKHAEASRAGLECEVLPGWLSLRAEDNGRGFDPAATSKGLGLRLLHDAVGLLGGSLLLDSSPEHGTHIRLRIPLTL